MERSTRCLDYWLFTIENEAWDRSKNVWLAVGNGGSAGCSSDSRLNRKRNGATIPVPVRDDDCTGGRIRGGGLQILPASEWNGDGGEGGPRGSWRGAIGCRRQVWKHVCVCVCVCGCGCGCDSFPSPEFIIKHKCAQFSSHETCLLTWPLLTKSEIFIFALKVCLGY